MRRTFYLAVALLAACSRPEPSSDRETKTFDVQEQPSRAYPPGVVPPPVAPAPPPVMTQSAGRASADEMAAGPNIVVAAAPGVAFNYRYAYRLPNARIQIAQEAHAAMCEKLGITRCRITGMRYSLVNEKDVSASLEMKLDPAIARQFGKDATKLVTDSEGMLIDQQISGVDAGASIERADRGRAELQDQLDRVTRELSRNGLSNVVRDRLLSEANSLRGQIAALGEQKASDEESLAKTPMAFYYGSGNAIPGFDEATPLRDALDRAGYNFLSAIGFLIEAVATLLPWLLLVALGVWLFRRMKWRLPPPSGGYRAAEPDLPRPPSPPLESSSQAPPRRRRRGPVDA
jgi:hypothetical protein